MKCKTDRLYNATLYVLFALTLAIPAFSQEKGQSSDVAYPVGQNVTIEGTIVLRNADGFKLRSLQGPIVAVNLAQTTEIRERKNNPFRRAKNYGITELLPGLGVEVKGHGSSAGSLIADEIRFRQDDYRLASTMDARVNPVENRLNTAESRLGRSEENAQRLSGQVSELSVVTNAARGGAKAAQETADNALESARAATEEAKGAQNGVRLTNDRISAIDDFDTKDSVTVNFKVGSSILSKEAKEELDKLADTAKTEKGFVIEVAGFASSDGSMSLNKVLSQRRADAVIDYLVENYSIPLRRFITPFGYGDKMPVGDNKTRTGRIQNRRVEVRILINKGLTQSAMVNVTAAR